MKVLVCCEESQRVCSAFRDKGHEAYSCDIIEPSGGHPEWHIKGDVLPYINGHCSFTTMDGVTHTIEGKWDLLICHPPCTYMSVAGASRMYSTKGQIDKERLAKALEAKAFFMRFINADCDRIAVENPKPLKVIGLPQYTQAIQPYEYGHPYSKRTCLWLKGLPKLQPTEIVKEHVPFVNGGSKKADGSARSKQGLAYQTAGERSKTFEGIAKAMADQWGSAQ